MGSRLSTAYPPHIHRFSFSELPVVRCKCGGNAVDKRWISGGCAKQGSGKTGKTDLKSLKGYNERDLGGESRKRQVARAYLIAGKAESRQGETEIRSYEFPQSRVGKPDIPCTGARIRSYEFPYATQVKSIVPASEKRRDPPHA